MSAVADLRELRAFWIALLKSKENLKTSCSEGKRVEFTRRETETETAAAHVQDCGALGLLGFRSCECVVVGCSETNQGALLLAVD